MARVRAGAVSDNLTNAESFEEELKQETETVIHRARKTIKEKFQKDTDLENIDKMITEYAGLHSSTASSLQAAQEARKGGIGIAESKIQKYDQRSRDVQKTYDLIQHECREADRLLSASQNSRHAITARSNLERTIQEVQDILDISKDVDTLMLELAEYPLALKGVWQKTQEWVDWKVQADERIESSPQSARELFSPNSELTKTFGRVDGMRLFLKKTIEDNIKDCFNLAQTFPEQLPLDAW